MEAEAKAGTAIRTPKKQTASDGTTPSLRYRMHYANIAAVVPSTVLYLLFNIIIAATQNQYGFNVSSSGNDEWLSKGQFSMLSQLLS